MFKAIGQMKVSKRKLNKKNATCKGCVLRLMYNYELCRRITFLNS